MMIRHGIHSDLPIPPGEYLAEVIAELGMTKDELTERTNPVLGAKIVIDCSTGQHAHFINASSTAAAELRR